MEGVPGPRRAPRYFQRGPGPAASLPVLSFWVMRWKAPCTWSYRWFIWRSFSSDSFCSAASRPASAAALSMDLKTLTSPVRTT